MGNHGFDQAYKCSGISIQVQERELRRLSDSGPYGRVAENGRAEGHFISEDSEFRNQSSTRILAALAGLTRRYILPIFDQRENVGGMCARFIRRRNGHRLRGTPKGMLSKLV